MPECIRCKQNFADFYGLNNHQRIHRGKETVDSEENTELWVDDNLLRDDNFYEEDLQPEPDATYLAYQNRFCSAVYGPEAFYCRSWADFVDMVRRDARFGKKLLTNVFSVSKFAKDASLTLNESKALVDLINEVAGPNDAIPKSFYQVSKLSNLRGETDIPFLVSTVNFPDRWMMNKWRIGTAPIPATISVRDPIACLSQQWMNPSIAFGNRHHIKFEYEELLFGSTGRRAYGDLYTTEWFRKTQEAIRAANPTAIDARVLPITLYHDGVRAGSYANVTDVIATCGLYSDELQRKEMAKFCLGYIANLKSINILGLMNHLVDVAKFTKTAATSQIKMYGLKINQDYWRLATKSIRENYPKGVLLKLLGDNTVHRYFPVVPFTVGDSPAQHLLSGVMSLNANRNCIHCMYKPRDNMPYDPAIYPFRNPARITKLCALAENICERKNTFELNLLETKNTKDKFKLTTEDKAILDELADQSIEPMVNAFHSVPMGVDNSIYNIPPDLFHVFCAGLIKHSVLWIMTIITNIASVDPKFNSSPGIVDKRLKDMPCLPKFPHLANTRFRRGLTTVATKKSKSLQANATGAGDGYRSGWWIDALLHLYFCIGHSGDVLPNQTNYILQLRTKGVDRHIELGNPTAKVFHSIYSMLDVYFHCKRSVYSEECIVNLENKMRNMKMHFSLLWDLKQAVLEAPIDKILRTIKDHDALHLADTIRRLGCLSKTNTDRFETSHKRNVKEVFKLVSHREITLLEEMLQKVIDRDWSDHTHHIKGILSLGYDYLKEKLLPKCAPSKDVFRRLYGNAVHWKLVFNASINFQFARDENKSLGDILHPQLQSPADKFRTLLHSTLTQKDEPENEYVRMNWWGRIELGQIVVTILSGVFYHGNAESMAGEGTIYAINSHRHNYGLPRYDFVTVQGVNNKAELAQVLNFVELSHGGSSKIFAIVAWLEPCPDNGPRNGRANDFFQRFKYGGGTNKNRRFCCDIDMIESETIIGHAFVVSDFSTKDVVTSKPWPSNRFYYVDRSWVDQSGWVDNIHRPRELTLTNIDEIENYLGRMTTSRLDDDEQVDNAIKDNRSNKKSSSSRPTNKSAQTVEGPAPLRSAERVSFANFFDIDLMDANTTATTSTKKRKTVGQRQQQAKEARHREGEGDINEEEEEDEEEDQLG